ncbi:MAG: tetratricopeptide repeat protein [Candidatus Zixiibacteriota bacterium]|nr:MAG: tetratricopeptide repeat protein [candidate division Zixibacteria bacterium]
MGDLKTSHKNLTPYIPRTILDWYQQSPADKIHVVGEYEGCIVCIDASGFTSLTQQLSARGKEGPEILTAVLNLFFEAVSSVIFRYQGDVLKFAGDALWAYFPNQPDLGSFFYDILDAVESVNSSPELADRCHLSVHAGAETGCFYLASLGDPGRRLEAEPLGNILEIVYQACDIAGDNELVVGPALARRVSESEELVSKDGDFKVVVPRFTNPPTQKFTDHAEPDSALNNIDLLKAYLPQDVLAKIETSVSSMSVQGEHRQVVVLFANFENNMRRKGDDPIRAVEILNAKLGEGFGIVRQFHGSIARIDPFKGGHKLLVLFGAPTKRENDEINALLCARGLVGLSDESFRIRIGLAIGPLFCGDVGAQRRREYTVMGDGINLAARLMSKSAWDQIIIGAALREKLPDEVQTEPVVLNLKGIGDKITCHRFTGVSERAVVEERSALVIGQADETTALLTAWRETQRGSRQLLAVTGPAGCGKSTLLTSFCHDHSEINPVQLSGKDARLFERGWLSKKLLIELIKRNASLRSADTDRFIKSHIESKWLPLLADFLNMEVEDNRWTRGLTPDLRSAKIKELFETLITTLVKTPSLVIVDDFDMVDEFFRTLVTSLAETKADPPLMFVIISRSLESVHWPDDSVSSLQVVAVDGPSEDQWWTYFTDNFENGKREEELFQRVLSASKGNPHFIMQFLGQCAAEKKLIKNRVSQRWELADSGLKISVPDGLADLHLSVFDSLPEMERTIMKAASVAIGDFSARLLHQGVPELDIPAIESHLGNLAKQDLLKHIPDHNRFNFTHASMREAVYHCIPESQLRALHRRFAEIVEKKDSDKHVTLLAYHFFRARILDKGFCYSLRAARQSLSRHALTEGSEFFNQCLNILRDSSKPALETSEMLTFYESYTHFLSLEGHYSQAHGFLREWRRFARRARLFSESLMPAIETASVLYKQSRYTRCRKVLNKVLQYADPNKDGKARAMALSILCMAERRTGDVVKAQELGRTAVEISEMIDDSSILAEARIRLGLAYWAGGKLDEAADVYLKAAESDKDDKRRSALARNNLAVIEQDRGNFVKAETQTIEALEIFRGLGDKRNEAYASGNLANICRIFGKLTKAEELFLHADLIFERLDDRHAHFYTVGNLGDIDLMRGETASAEHRFRLVHEFARDIDDKELIAECEVRFGELSFFAGDISDAEARYRKAISVAEEVDSTEYLTRACVGLARLLIGEKDHRQALEVIERIAELAAANKAILPENEAIFLTGEHHRITSDFAKAADCYRKALDYARSQNLFELILKLAARLYETDPSSKEEAFGILSELKEYFISNNSLPAWDQLLESSYFSYFADTLYQVVGSSQLCESPSM